MTAQSAELLDQSSQISQSSKNEFLLQWQNSNLMQHKSGKGAEFSLAAATQKGLGVTNSVKNTIKPPLNQNITTKLPHSFYTIYIKLNQNYNFDNKLFTNKIVDKVITSNNIKITQKKILFTIMTTKLLIIRKWRFDIHPSIVKFVIELDHIEDCSLCLVNSICVCIQDK
jgi:hypothetical protein